MLTAHRPMLKRLCIIYGYFHELKYRHIFNGTIYRRCFSASITNLWLTIYRRLSLLNWVFIVSQYHGRNFLETLSATNTCVKAHDVLLLAKHLWKTAPTVVFVVVVEGIETLSRQLVFLKGFKWWKRYISVRNHH